MRPVNTYIGAGVPRREDERFLTGRGQYVGDLSRQGLLHAAILRSPVAHGRIRTIGTAAATALPGVHAVFTAADIARPLPRIPMRQESMPELKPFEQPVIADAKVRYVGEPVGIIIAESEAIAQDALSAIVLDIDTLPAAVDRDSSLQSTALLFEESGSNIATTLQAVKGDASAAFSAHRGIVHSARFSVHRHTAAALEPRGLLAEWDAATNRLTLHGAAKVPFTNRRILARHMGLSESQVRLVENDVGGGFGARGEFYPEDFLVAFAARTLNRPVKWVEDRRENLLATNHAREAACELEIACENDGTIVALRGEVYADLGAYIRTVGATPARNIIQVLSGPYRIPHVDVSVSLLLSNRTPVGTYRGPGRYEADFFRERLFDMMAAQLGMDRVAFRKKNLLTAPEMPYPLATVVPLNIATETDSGDYHATLSRCLSEIGWDERQALNGQLIDGRYHGIAFGCYFEGGASGPREHARLALEKDGTVSVYVGSSAVGQGLETAFAQIAADALALPMDRIGGVFHGSTDHVAEGFGSYSSRSVVMGGSAIVAAAKTLRAAIQSAAARRLACTPAQVDIDDGLAIGPDRRSIALSELAAAETLSVEESFSSSKRTYSYGAHAAHVAVDIGTGHVELIDYVAVEDVGRIVNPHMLHGQTMGAIVQGLGRTLMEHLVHDTDGQPLTATLADYLLPTAADFANIHVIALEEHPSPHNPLGAKGAGEGGIIPVGGVIANAVAAALQTFGVEPNALPLSPPRIWSLIQQAQEAANVQA